MVCDIAVATIIIIIISIVQTSTVADAFLRCCKAQIRSKFLIDRFRKGHEAICGSRGNDDVIKHTIRIGERILLNYHKLPAVKAKG